jgi:hypothetical protein
LTSISLRAVSMPTRAPMPLARWYSAVLTTMSTRPPISPASSTTERESVGSSGTGVTCGSAAIASKPGSRFHGSACPAQIRSAPASASARTIAWPTADFASVTSTLRNFGSQVISRSCGSSLMFGVSREGNATSTA